MFGLHATFTLLPDGADAFDQMAQEVAASSLLLEPGTLVYAVCRDQARPDVRIFLEIYQDRGAFEVHEHQQHVVRFLAARERFLSRPVEVEWLDVQNPSLNVALTTLGAGGGRAE